MVVPGVRDENGDQQWVACSVPAPEPESASLWSSGSPPSGEDGGGAGLWVRQIPPLLQYVWSQGPPVYCILLCFGSHSIAQAGLELSAIHLCQLTRCSITGLPHPALLTGPLPLHRTPLLSPLPSLLGEHVPRKHKEDHQATCSRVILKIG